MAVLASLVWYEPETGAFTRLGGTPIGTRHCKGYVSIKLGGYECLAHRLAWYMTHGEAPDEIDHKNRGRSDNRIDNLRPATRSQNGCNRGPQANSTSGVSGVARNRQDTAWQAYIKLSGKRKHLGTFRDFGEAVAARKEAEAAMFGSFAPDANPQG